MTNEERKRAADILMRVMGMDPDVIDEAINEAYTAMMAVMMEIIDRKVPQPQGRIIALCAVLSMCEVKSRGVREGLGMGGSAFGDILDMAGADTAALLRAEMRKQKEGQS